MATATAAAAQPSIANPALGVGGLGGPAHLTVARIAEALAVSWNTANDAVLAEGRQRVLIEDVTRFDGVAVIGVDEHVWRHTRRGDKYVTVIIDLAPIRDGTGPCRLLDMVPGRSKQAFKTWLTASPQAWRKALEVVAMDGFNLDWTRGDPRRPELENDFFPRPHVLAVGFFPVPRWDSPDSPSRPPRRALSVDTRRLAQG